MKDFINRYGKPLKLHSDDGKEFYNKLLQEYCIANDISYIRGRPYHPQSQGCIGAYNKEIKRLLKNIYLKNKKFFQFT